MSEALGDGLTRFQYIDTALYLLAFALLKTDARTASIAFFQHRTAENRLAMVDRLVFYEVSQHVRTKVWKPIVENIRDSIEFRNILAHFEVFCLTDQEFSLMEPKTACRYVLSAHHLDHYSRRSGISKIMSAELVESNGLGLISTTEKITHFALEHVPVEEQQEASLPIKFREWLQKFRQTKPSIFSDPPVSPFPQP